MLSKKNIQDIIYYERKDIVDVYLKKKIKETFDLGLDYSFFKFKGEWLEEPAEIYEAARGYMVKVEELIKFAAIRKYDIIYLKSGVGAISDISDADGILLGIA